MKYGQHNELVEEVIDFVKASIVLKPSSAFTPLPIEIINDLLEAQRMAWEATYGKDELSWTDVREREMSKVKATLYGINDFYEIRENLSQLIKSFTLYLRRTLDDKHKLFLDDIVADLYNCAVSRAVNGAVPCFYEQIFQAYQLGGFPCGWSGDYPVGTLVVYVPKD